MIFYYRQTAIATTITLCSCHTFMNRNAVHNIWMAKMQRRLVVIVIVRNCFFSSKSEEIFKITVFFFSSVILKDKTRYKI